MVKIVGPTKKGMKGPQVRGLQVMLTGYGYACGTVDGYFGDKTDAAVRLYQKIQGLTIDGIVGKKTWSRLVTIRNTVINLAKNIPKYTSLASVRTVGLDTCRGYRTFKVWAQSKSSLEYVRGSGCALSSALMAAYPFAKGVVTPTTFHKALEKKVTGRSDSKSGCPLAPLGAVKVLKYYGIKAEWKPYGVSRDTITAHLRKGKPVLIWLIDKSGKYTSYLHTVLLAGVTETGKWIMLDSGGRKLDGRYSVKICDPADVYKHIRFCSSGKAANSMYWKGESSTTGIVLVKP